MDEREADSTMRQDEANLMLKSVEAVRIRNTDGYVGIGDVVELTDAIEDLRNWLQSTYDLRCQMLRRLQKEGVKVSEMVQATGVTKQAVHLMLAKGRRLTDAGLA